MMIKELFAVWTNARFWMFMIIAFLPLWAGMIAIPIVMIEKKLGLIEE